VRKCSFLFLCFFASFLPAQEASLSEIILQGVEAHKFISGAEVVRLYPYTQIPAFVKFRGFSGISEEQGELWLSKLAKFDQNGGLKLVRKESDELGFTHYRFIQLFKGFEIFGTTYILHFKNGFLVSANGLLYDHVSIQDGILDEKKCLDLALKFINADVYKWQLPEEEAHARYEFEVEKIRKSPTYYPTGVLKIIPSDGDFQTSNHSFRLSYVFDIYADEPMDRSEVFVDVQNGNINFKNPLLMHSDVNGRAKTAYSDTQSIKTDSVSPVYFRLRETGRGNGIQTFNLNKGTNYGTATDFIDSNNFWHNVNANKDEYATDAHWGAEMTYDYFWTKHNRNSIDNAGFLLKSYIHYSTNFTNAYWDGTRMTYGDGAAPYTPLVAMDIAGHEIAHGLTSNTSNLIYSNESGALNESFSDIFGVAIDFYSRPTLANFLMGDGIGGAPFRNMANPNQYSDPDTYLGSFWYSGTADNGGVHSNSGVQNYWFYLMINGGIGKNDKNDSFWVNRLGIDTAGKIAFRNNSYYLTPTSQYADARFYGIQSAIDLYGPCSKAVISTTNAWHAVGVGARFDSTVIASFVANTTVACAAPQTIRFTNLSNNGYTFKWKFGTGDSSSSINPSYKYLSNGKFTVTLIADGGACGIDTLIRTNYIELDPHNDCVAYIGDTITNKCFGTLYDDGGPNNSYQTNKTQAFTISPTSATSIALQFLDFDVEAGTSAGVCNYDYVQLHNGTTTAAASLGKFCNTNKPLTTPYSSGSSATINMLSDPAATGRGFELKWQCSLPNAKPNVRFSTNTLSTCTGLVSFKDETYNNPTSWNWSFGDGGVSTLKNPVYTYQNNGLYNVRLIATNAFGSDTFTKAAYISVNKPTKPFVADTLKIRCGTGTVMFAASGAGNIEWFDSINSNTILNTGTNFTTPSIAVSRDFYVQSTVTNPILNYGPLDTNIGTGGYHTAIPPAYMIFDAARPCRLLSVKVRANSTKARRFQLMDKYGLVLRDTTITVSSGTQIVTLNFNIPMGTDLRLGIYKDSSAGLYRNSAGANYPYTDASGLIKIKGHSFSATAPSAYYYFYDWKVKEDDCKSSRVKVSAKVQQPIVLKNLDTFNCNGSNIVLTPSGNDIDSIYWTTGNVSALTRSLSPSTTTNYIYSAFNVCGEYKDTATITSLSIPSFNFVGNDTTICKGQSVKLIAKGNLIPFWKNQGITDTSILVSPSSTTFYPIEIINSCGIARDTIKATVVDTPSLIARTDTSICLGSSVLLNATSNFPITWYPMNTVGSSVSVSPTVNSIYYAEVNTSCGMKRDTVMINLLTTPSLVVSNDTSVCAGSSIKLKAYSSVTPLWVNQSIADTSINVSPTVNTYYPVQASNVCGIVRDTVSVQIISKPIVSISGDTLYTCIGNSVLILASSTHSIIWKPNGTSGNTNTVTASATTKYFAESQNVCGKVSDSIVLSVETAPPIITTSPDTTICRGQSISLNANANGIIYWNELATSLSTVSVAPNNNAKYTVQANNACGISHDSIKVGVDSLLNLQVSNDTLVCLGSIAKLNYVKGIMTNWTPPGISTSSIHYVVVNSPTMYYATAQNKCGIYKDSVKVDIRLRPTIYGGRDTTVCPGKPVSLSAVSNGTVTWLGFSTGNNLMINPFASRQYIAAASNQCGTSLDSVYIAVYPLPKSIPNGKLNDKVVTFTNSSLNAASFKWYFGDGDSSMSYNPVYTYKQYGTYTMRLIASNQCGHDTATMIVILKSNSSVQNVESANILVYPNPVSSFLNFDFKFDFQEAYAKVYDVTGRLILEKALTKDASPKLDMSSIAHGNYLLILNIDDKTYQYKITKE
jgi:Zn-dependent metalloprotease